MSFIAETKCYIVYFEIFFVKLGGKGDIKSISSLKLGFWLVFKIYSK